MRANLDQACAESELAVHLRPSGAWRSNGEAKQVLWCCTYTTQEPWMLIGAKLQAVVSIEPKLVLVSNCQFVQGGLTWTFSARVPRTFQ